ncbi:MAG: HEPN domain-containing protein [Candidatus Methanoperedens sp.]
MKVNKSEIHNNANTWIAFAEEDLRMAQYSITMKNAIPYRLIAFHAQQCAEKYLKAYLVFKSVDFPYTHDIFRLLELCAENADWAEKLEDAKRLTLYAITTRYPGTEDGVTRDEALHAIDLASLVRDVVRNALSKEDMIIEEDTFK